MCREEWVTMCVQWESSLGVCLRQRKKLLRLLTWDKLQTCLGYIVDKKVGQQAPNSTTPNECGRAGLRNLWSLRSCTKRGGIRFLRSASHDCSHPSTWDVSRLSQVVLCTVISVVNCFDLFLSLTSLSTTSFFHSCHDDYIFKWLVCVLWSDLLSKFVCWLCGVVIHVV